MSRSSSSIDIGLVPASVSQLAVNCGPVSYLSFQPKFDVSKAVASIKPDVIVRDKRAMALTQLG